MIIWLLGISGAGKTTTGHQLVSLLRNKGKPCLLLDGDELREVWGNDLGHDLADRRRNHERVTRLIRLLAQEPALTLIVCMVSLFPELRRLPDSGQTTHEIFFDLSLEAAARRDPKQIYARARRGELEHVAGVDIAFPAPESPLLHLCDEELAMPPEAVAARIYQALYP